MCATERKLGLVEDFAGHRPARERAKVAAPMNRSAAAVITTVTPAPPCTSWLTSAAVLNAAIPPVTPTTISRPA